MSYEKAAGFFIVFVLLTFQCSHPTIRFNALYPAEIDIPADIKSIALIDRTAPENKVLNILEGGLTGEGIGQDKMASQITLNAVYRTLSNADRYQAIRTNEVLKGSRSGSTMPDPLPWETIEQLSKKYDAHVILSLESFDSEQGTAG